MKGDFSRDTFDKSKHYNSVLMQQGRVQLDADWNEQQAINRYHEETYGKDIIGTGAPDGPDCGFKIMLDNGRLKIGRGRYYVDGILCENDREPYYFDEQVGVPLNPLENNSFGLVYLDVWNRHITALDDPDIKEKALGDPDTTTRIKTVWRVRIHQCEKLPTCDKKIMELVDPTYVVDNRGKMDAQTIPTEGETPCYLPSPSKYQGIENQLYRVEIHNGGFIGTRNRTGNQVATFKWSRDNGSIVAGIEGISGIKITVSDLGKDDALGFKEEQWVEISDDSTELNGDPGFITQIKHIDRSKREIELDQPCTLVFKNGMHTKLRRWDKADSNGLKITGDWQDIERGIQVNFLTGNYMTGDYWLIPARTATGDIEWSSGPQLRRGIEHHYCPLAVIKYSRDKYEVLTDCRKFFPSLSDLKEKKPSNGKTELQITNVRIKYSDKNDEIDLINDSEIEIDKFDYLIVEFNKEIEETFILNYNSKSTNPIFFVTVYIPFPILFLDSGIKLYSDNIIGYQPLVLSANLKKHDDHEDMLKWEMKSGKDGEDVENGTKAWIEKLLDKFKNHGVGRDHLQLLAQLTIKCNYIWASEDETQYLDGDTLGIKIGEHIGLKLPSGDGRKGGDFEMWFWLKLSGHGIE